MSIDLNADVGEGYDDEQLLPLVTTVNIACGAHAGDVVTMNRVVAQAAELGLTIGAHPSYPDREGFGRRVMDVAPDELRASLLDQIHALIAIAEARAARVSLVKPHGALYHAVVHDAALADVVIDAVRAADPTLGLVCLPDSALLRAAARAGMPALRESFADRRYRSDGTLAPRNLDGAVIQDPALAAQQALRIASGAPIDTIDGGTLLVDADTICLHGDSPHAVASAAAVRARLEAEGIVIAPRG